MDPKQQAEIFYKSLAAVDAVSCAILARGARMQRGRVASLKRRISELEAKDAPKAEIVKLEAEAGRRTALAAKFDALDGVIDGAIKAREALDKEKIE